MRPPPLARRFLRRLVPPGVRDALVGDLDEEFDRKVAPSRSRRSANWWYWRQVLRSLPGVMRLRRQARNRAATQSGYSKSGSPLEPFVTDLRYGIRRAGHQPSLVATIT